MKSNKDLASKWRHGNADQLWSAICRSDRPRLGAGGIIASIVFNHYTSTTEFCNVLSFNGLRGLYQLQSERNDLIASATKSGNSSCTESLPSGKTAVRMLGTDANASISARERDGV